MRIVRPQAGIIRGFYGWKPSLSVGDCRLRFSCHSKERFSGAKYVLTWARVKAETIYACPLWVFTIASRHRLTNKSSSLRLATIPISLSRF